uniref:Ycf36 n=1 Tax=Helminthora furcellata TaxID=1884666 RepID=A0A1G4NR78_9FLOR|nr:Hypothetical protein ycf36 [Helminthora furcellata]SCW21163.1 Hypothetical protein ycf36 [Helminthora furcellata]SCW24023.1 Hypothetical protein ycf36 [Helminthora furcellata]
MSLHKKICPVPFDQQPLNEYKALRKSPLFASSATELSRFISRLSIVFSSVILLCLAINSMSLSTTKISLSTVGYDILCSLLSIELLLIRLYLGWSYVLKRLFSASIFYEESGWYDGQLWIKTVDILTQDRLVGLYQVQPLVIRIRRLLVIISCASIFLMLSLLLL